MRKGQIEGDAENQTGSDETDSDETEKAVKTGAETDGSSGNTGEKDTSEDSDVNSTSVPMSQAEQAMALQNMGELSNAAMEYDAANRLIRYNGEEVRYDADGNMIHGPLNGVMTDFTYDCRNRLVQAGTTAYEYNAENTRTAVIEENTRTDYVVNVHSELSQVLEEHVKDMDGESRTITYVYGNGLIYHMSETEESPKEDSLSESDNSEKEEETENSGQEQGNVEGSITEDTDSNAGTDKSNNGNADGNIEKNTDKNTDKNTGSNETDITVYHYNHLGSTTGLTNGSGEILEQYTYGTYGELLSGDTSLTPYLYNGMLGVSTDEKGLYYMRARYYNTDIKRFINQDVVRGDIGNSKSLNRYSYVQGNPVSLTDPFGLSPLSWNALGHSVLNLLGMIPYVGDAFDLVNAAWYYSEGNYKMATLSLLSGLTLAGGAVSEGLCMFKCFKAAKYVKVATHVISAAATFVQAGGGTIRGVRNVVENIKNGDFFTKKNLIDMAGVAVNVVTMVCSGKSMMSSGKELFGMMKSDVPKVWGAVKQGAKEVWLNNRGGADWRTTANGAESGSNTGKYQKASLWERITKRKADVNELHANPLDEFSNPKIGPCESAVSKYIKQIN